MSDGIMVIESDEYRQEQAVLQADPIIDAMAGELAVMGGEIGMTSWEFTQGALAEYKRRGGVGHQTIGGPARAIRALLADSVTGA